VAEFIEHFREVLTVFLGVVFAGVIGLTHGDGAFALPVLATQILWINLLTDSAPALAMGVDFDTEDVMRCPPRSMADRVIDRRMWAGVIVIGLAMAIVTLLTIDLYLPGGLVEGSQTLDNARTAGFTVLVLAQLFNALNARSETGTAFHRLFAKSVALGRHRTVRRPPGGGGTRPVPQRCVHHRTALARPVAGLHRHGQRGAWVSELRKVVLRLADNCSHHVRPGR
jgi:magnesium-transporting ATPase (P-type)